MIHLISNNAFRILGLSGTSTYEEIQTQMKSFLRGIKLGVVKQTNWDHLNIGPFARTERDISHADTKLNNSVERIQERFFWFHSNFNTISMFISLDWGEFLETIEYCSSSEKYISRHDLILLFVIKLCMEDLNFESIDKWDKLLDVWHRTFSLEEYWLEFMQLEQETGFQPTTNYYEIESLKNEVINLPLNHLFNQAKNCFINHEEETFRNLVIILTQSTNELELEKELIQFCEGNIEEHCLGNQMQIAPIFEHQEKLPVDEIISLCNLALKNYRQDIEPRLNLLILSFSLHELQIKRISEYAAKSLQAISFAYTWANDYVMAAFICNKALKLIEPESLLYDSLQKKHSMFSANALTQIKEQKSNYEDESMHHQNNNANNKNSSQTKQNITKEQNIDSSESKNSIENTAENRKFSKLAEPNKKHKDSKKWSVFWYILSATLLSSFFLLPMYYGNSPSQINATLGKQGPLKEITNSQKNEISKEPLIITQNDPAFVPLHTDGLSNITVDNSHNKSNVRVKLFYVGSSKIVRQIQIRSGDQFKIQNISSGKYDLRYEEIGTGKFFKTEEFNLTEIKSSDGVTYSELSITLYTVTNGNTRMIPIQEKDFN